MIINAKYNLIYNLTSNPSQVSQINTTLQFTILSGDKDQIQTNAAFQLILPSTNDFQFQNQANGTSPFCQITYLDQISPINCILQNINGTQQIIWITQFQISLDNRVTFSALACFNNPITTASTPSFLFTIYQDSSLLNILSDQTNDVITLTATFMPLSPKNQLMVATQNGSEEVGKPTQAILKMQNTVPLPPNTIITIQFPVVNPSAQLSIQRQSIINPTNFTCSAIQNVDKGLSSSIIRQQQPSKNLSLQINNAFPNGADSGTQIQILLDSIYNPLSVAPRYFLATFQIVDNFNVASIIQQGVVKWKAQKPTTIEQVSINSIDNTVSEYTQFQIAFRPIVDIEQGATIMIRFPVGQNVPYFQFDNQLSIMNAVGGIFGGLQNNVRFKQNNANLQLTTVNGSSSYSPVSTNTITLSKIQNPSYKGDFRTFRIYVYDQNQQLIAQTYQNISYATKTGTIQSVKLYSDSYLVESFGNLTIEFAPYHNLGLNSSIVIQLTNEFNISCPQVFDFNSQQLQNPLNISCNKSKDNSNNIILVYNPFVNNFYQYQAGQVIRIVFQNSQMPNSSRNISSLNITTLNQNNKYVDQFISNQTLLTVQPAPFFFQQITTNSNETLTDTNFNFNLIIANSLFTGSFIDIQFPLQVQLSESYGQSLLVIPGQNTQQQISVSTTTTLQNGNIFMRISNFMQPSNILGSNTTISFTLAQMKTPFTTQSTDTFSIYTRDSLNRTINYVETDLFITQLQGKYISTLQVNALSYQVGQLSSHSFYFQTPVPIDSSDSITIIYPFKELILQPNASCTGSQQLSQTQQYRITKNIVQVNPLLFALDNNGNQQQQLQINQILNLTISFSINPSSGRPTKIFQLFIKDKYGYTKAQMTNTNNTNASIQMQFPSQIQKFSFQPIDSRQLATTTFILSFYSTQQYPIGSNIQIKMNSSQIGPISINQNNNVKCSTNLQFTVNCSFTDVNQLQIRGAIVQTLVPNSYVSLQITNMFVNITYPTISDSWILTVFSQDNYLIDQINNSLSVEYKCFSPCETCLWDSVPSQPGFCTSCNSLTNENILFQGQCYDQCPDGSFYNDTLNTCLKCDSTCLTCSPTNGNYCLTCNQTGKLPFLDGTLCRSDCRFGTYGDVQKGQCLPCKSPCQSCRSKADYCNTCDIKSLLPFYMNSVCKSQCDDGYTVPLGNTDYICLQCDQNCLTCIGNLKNCLTCKEQTNPFLSLLDNTCKPQCPANISVLTDPVNKICSGCDSLCKTCSNLTINCTSCQQGYSLYQYINKDNFTQQTCVKDCSQIPNIQPNTMVSFNNVCINCSKPCATCQSTSGQCLSCFPGFFIYHQTCVSQCPNLFSPDPNDEKRCILTGLICPFGYAINETTGDSCYLKARICEGTDILNYDNTKCIPQPKIFIPVPLIILFIIGSVIIVRDKKKNLKSRFYANMISLLSLLETIGLLSLVGLSGDYGIHPSFWLSFFAMIFLYGTNLFFFFIYWTKLKQDSAFKYWELEYELSSLSVVFISLIANFKCYRLFYSRFQERKQFNAIFQDNEIFYKTTIYTSAFYIFAITVPILVASIFSLYYISLWYQIKMFCIEMIFIESFLIIFLCIEMIKIRKYIFRKQNYISVDKKDLKRKSKSLQNQFLEQKEEIGNKFFGIFKQKSILNQVGPYNYEQQNQNQKIYFKLNKNEQIDGKQNETIKILLRLIQCMNLKDAGKRYKHEYTTIQEIEDLHEEQNRNKLLRRCISFKDQREYEDCENDEMQQMLAEGYDSQDSEKEKYNFISEPNSPRQKEMLQNNNFNKRMKELSKAFKMRDKYDNCYSEPKSLHSYQYRQCKVVSRAVQTNVLELLGVDDWQCQKAYSKYNNNLNNELEYNSIDEDADLVDAAKQISNGLFNNIIDQFEGFQENKKRKQLPPQRMKNLPKFELNELIGDFDIDIQGNQIYLNKGVDQNGVAILQDKQGRRVNNRGYFIDDNYNVIKANGQVIFKPQDVDSDGEIPAPFCYQKFKNNLGIEEIRRKQKALDEQQMEDELIEKEFQKIKSELIQKQNGTEVTDERNESERSLKSDDLENKENNIAPSKFKKEEQLQPELYNPNDEDYISRLVKPMKPLSKDEILLQFKKKGIEIKRKEFNIKSGDMFNFAQSSNFENLNKNFAQQDISIINQEKSQMNINGDQDFRFNSRLLNSNSNNQSKSNFQLNINKKKNPKKYLGDSSVNDNLSHTKFKRIKKSNDDQKTLEEVHAKNYKKIGKAEVQKLLLEDPQKLLKDAELMKKREEDLQDGIKKFHDMLARYPLKPKNKRNSNTLANKTLERVYGRIKKQYAINIQRPEQQYSKETLIKQEIPLIVGDSNGMFTQQSYKIFGSRIDYNINRNSSLAQNSLQSKSNVSGQLQNLGSISQYGFQKQNSLKQNHLMKNSSHQSHQYQVKQPINTILGLVSNSSDVNNSKRVHDFSKMYGRDQILVNKLAHPVLQDKKQYQQYQALNQLGSGQFTQFQNNDGENTHKTLGSGKDILSSNLQIDSQSFSRTKFQKQFPLTQAQSNYIKPEISLHSLQNQQKNQENQQVQQFQFQDEENFGGFLNQDTFNADAENDILLNQQGEIQFEEQIFNNQQNYEQFVIEEGIENLQVTDEDIKQNISFKDSSNDVSNENYQ